jgi:hypothetical protein
MEAVWKSSARLLRLAWRPQLLPYLVVVHGLLDLATVLMIPTAV